MKLSDFGKHSNDKLAYAITFFSSMPFGLGIWFFFYTDYVGFSATVAPIIVVVYTAVIMLFEVPSGVWADKYGRKKLMIVGSLITIVGLIPYIATIDKWLIVIGSFVGGIGMAMVTGCLNSIVYDWLKEQGKQKDFRQFTRKKSQFSYTARIFASIIGAVVFTIHPVLPYVLVMTANVIRAVLCLFLFETTFHRVDEVLHSTGDYIRDGWKYLTGIRRTNVLMVGFIGGMCLSQIVWGQYQPLLEGLGVSIAHIGWFYAGASALSVLGTWLSKYWYDHDRTVSYLNTLYVGGLLLGFILLLVLPGWWLLVGIVVLQLVFSPSRPIVTDAINHVVPSTHRSTTNSIISLLYSGTRVIGGGVSGWVLTRFGFEGTWILVACLGGLLWVGVQSHPASQEVVIPESQNDL